MARRIDLPPERFEPRQVPARAEPCPEPQDAVRPAQGMLCAAALSAPLQVLIWWGLRKLLF